MAYQPKSYRKFLATTVTASLVATAVAPVAGLAASNFTDVNSNYEAAVNFLVENEITSGLTETTFGTSAQITRGDAAVLVAKALELDTDLFEAAPFTDVNARQAGAVSALYALNVINGKTDTTFAPNAPITRQEMAKVIANAFELVGAGEALPFTDVNSTFSAYVDALYTNGITSGKTETSFGSTQEITRGEFAIFLFRALTEEVVEATEVVGVTASAANKLAVEFNGAVDQDAAEFEVKLGFVPQDIEVEFSEDGKTAYLVSEDNFIAGDYTVVVGGLELEEDTFEVEVKAQKIASFTIETARLTAVTTQSFEYQALDQYGNEFDVVSSNFTATARNASNGNTVTLGTDGNKFAVTTDLSLEANAKIGDTIVVTLVHNNTGLSQSATLKLEASAYIDTLSFGTPEPKEDVEKIYEGDDSEDLVLPLTLVDQYGTELEITDALLENITFISSNEDAVDPNNFAVNDDNELTYVTGEAGNVTLTAISEDSGKTAKVTFTVAADAALKTVAFSQPSGLIVAGEEVEVAYQAVDTEGKELKLASKDDLVWFSSKPSVAGVEDITVEDGVLSVTPLTEGSTTISAFLGGVKQGEFVINAKAAAVPTKITGLSADAITNFNTNEGSYEYSLADFVIIDQYNRVIKSDSDALDATELSVAIKGTDAGLVDVTAGTTVSAEANTKTGSQTLTVSYDGITRDFSVNVVAETAVVGYELTDLTSELLFSGYEAKDELGNLLYDVADYSETITIEYGLNKDGVKVALSSDDAADLLVTNSNDTVVNVAGATITAVADSNDEKATVTAFKKGIKISEVTFTTADVEPKLSKLVLDETAVELEVDGTTTVGPKVASTLDQYNREFSATGLKYYSSNSTVAVVNTTSGLVTANAKGTAVVTVVAPNGVTASYEVTVK